MNRYLLAAVAAAGLTLSGCNNSPEGGTPGTSSSFTVMAPTIPTTIKQDNRETVKLTLNRGPDFKKAVKFDVTAPDKIKAELSKSTVAAGEPGEVALTISVAKDAPLGDHVVKVTATPDSGTATSVDVKVKVDKNP